MSERWKERFRQGCGLIDPLGVRVTGPVAATSFSFEPPFLLVGRDPCNGLPLPDSRVSRRHAYLQVIAGRVFCLDLDSRDGLLWEGETAPRPFGWLDGRQSVRVGPFTLSPQGKPAPGADLPADWNPLEERADDARLLSPVEVEVADGGQIRQRWRMSRVLVLVGQLPRCRLRLRHPTVSRYHCALVGTPLGVWAVDLLGRGGIAVNGRPTRWAPLGDGDELVIGVYTIRLRYQAAAAVPSISPQTCQPPAGGTVVAPVEQEQGAGLWEEKTHLSVPSLQVPVVREGTLLQGLSPDAGLPVSGEGWPEQGLLLPVIHQFNLMQQQMFDQFQRTVLLLAQMFTTLHQDQMALVRDELAQLRKVNEELHSLQGELKNQRPGSSGSPAGPSAAVAEGGPVALGAGPAPAQGAGQTGAASATTPSPAPRPGQGERPVPPAGTMTGEDVHAWLTGRIASLQQERQNRWQKVFDFVRGR